VGFNDILRNLDQKYPSSFLGLVVGIIALMVGIIIGFLGIYLTLFYEKKPEILFDVISNYRVYDIRENIGSLQISFEGENIKEKGLTLSLITIRIANTSRVDILKTFFDEKDPLGLEINSSRIIKYDVIATSNQYLNDTLKITQNNDNSLALAPIIIESDQFITLKLLVIHPEKLTPKITPFGKVAGVKQIKVQEEPQSGTLILNWSRAYSGDVIIQVIRIVIYGFGLVILVISIIISHITIPELLETRKRKKYVKAFKKANKRDFSNNEDLIFKTYINRGEFFIVKLERLLEDKNLLKVQSSNVQSNKEDFRDITEMPFFDHFSPNYIINFILNHRIATITDSDVVCDPNSVNTVKEFVMFLSAHIPDQIELERKALH